MDTVNRLTDHLQSIYADGGWTDVPVRGVFEALDHVEASARPIPGRHTAWEILLHLDAWHGAVRRRLQGEVVLLSPEEDWPSPPASTAKSWQAALEMLDAGFEALLDAVRSFPDDELFKQLGDGRHSAYETISGIGEHDLYHAGQVTLLKGP